MNNIITLKNKLRETEEKIELLNREKEELIITIRTLEKLPVDIEVRSNDEELEVPEESDLMDVEAFENIKVEGFNNLSGVNPHRLVRNEGAVFRYDKRGNFVGSYANSLFARDQLEKEKGKDCSVLYIEYASTGSVNHKNEQCNHHTYGGSLWFDRELTEKDKAELKIKRVFK